MNQEIYFKAFLSVLAWIAVLVANANGKPYLIGTGIADITGPAADVNMMGYANMKQRAGGIHIRQYSRAFIFVKQEETRIGNGSGPSAKRIVFVNIDACMGTTLVKAEVMKHLRAKYGELYQDKNVAISGIHTHSGPAGFLQYLLYDVSSLGFVRQTFQALVNGIYRSIQRAHSNIRPGKVFINSGRLMNSSINRSPSAYLRNPADERKKYVADGNTDKLMTVVKLVDTKGQAIGMLSWFAVHCTSMNNTNKFISGDNKGYAAQMFERTFNGDAPPGQGRFVAGFATSNEGDVSPNTHGPHCLNNGRPCDNIHSTCNGNAHLCVASGPGKNMMDSTRIIGENQFQRALELFNGAKEELTGPIDFVHQYVNMTNITMETENGTRVRTCPPAMGYSFAAGTTDGPGAFDFRQGTTSGNKFWNWISSFLSKPSPAQVQCHHPKPILLNTGEMDAPWRWQPHIVPTQILRLGSLWILAVPAEFTTMSGRRLRESVDSALLHEDEKNATLVIAGLSNAYSSYVATYEEYQVQRYEGASTIFGPHTLQAYMEQFRKLARIATSNGTRANLSDGPSPPNLLRKVRGFLLPVIFDAAPWGKKFGDVLRDAKSTYKPFEQVSVVFVTGNPRNNLMQDGSFLTVERQLNAEGREGTEQKWIVEFTDANWETLFDWRRVSTIKGESQATLSWNIPANQKTGFYRMCHFGYYKPLFGLPKSFHACSKTFKVIHPPRK